MLRAGDGFSRYGSQADLLRHALTDTLVWSLPTGSVSFVSPGHNGVGSSLKLGSGAVSGTDIKLIGAFAANSQTLFFGLGIEMIDADATDTGQLTVSLINVVASYTQAFINFDSPSGQLKVYDSTSTLIYTSPVNTFPRNKPFYLEAMLTIGVGSTAGSITLRINGIFLTSIPCTTLNTLVTWSGIQLEVPSTSGSVKQTGCTIDNFALFDTVVGSTGLFPGNVFTGPLEIKSGLPIAEGAVEWVPNSGNNWQGVAGTNFTSPSDWVYHQQDASAVISDLYLYPEVNADLDFIAGIIASGVYQSNGEYGTTIIHQGVLDGAASVVGGTITTLDHVDGTGYFSYSTPMGDNPIYGSPWTIGDANNLSFGPSLASGLDPLHSIFSDSLAYSNVASLTAAGWSNPGTYSVNYAGFPNSPPKVALSYPELQSYLISPDFTGPLPNRVQATVDIEFTGDHVLLGYYIALGASQYALGSNSSGCIRLTVSDYPTPSVGPQPPGGYFNIGVTPSSSDLPGTITVGNWSPLEAISLEMDISTSSYVDPYGVNPPSKDASITIKVNGEVTWTSAGYNFAMYCPLYPVDTTPPSGAEIYTNAIGAISFNSGFPVTCSMLVSNVNINGVANNYEVQCAQFALEYLTFALAYGESGGSGGVYVPPVYPALVGLTYDYVKAPIFSNTISQGASGAEVSIEYWESPLWEWQLSYEYLPDAQANGSTSSDFKTLVSFFCQQRGDALPFYYLDPDDNTVVGQAVGTGDGTTQTFNLYRTYGADGFTTLEPIGGLNVGLPINVYVNGSLVSPSTYTLLTGTPLSQGIRFNSAPALGAVITADFSYYFYVRFGMSTQEFNKVVKQLWDTKKIVLRSKRNP